MLDKIFKIIFASLLILSCPLAADSAPASVSSPTIKNELNKEANNAKEDESDIFVQSVYKDFKAGKYNEFLSKIDASLSSPEAQSILKQQEAMVQIIRDNKDRFKTVMKNFETEYNALKQKRNEKLIAVCKNQEKEKICQLVNRIATVSPEDQFTEISTDTDIFLNQDSNDPIVQQYIKAMQDGIAKQSLGYFDAQKNNVTDDDVLERQHLAIQLSVFDKFAQISAKNPDHSIVKQLPTVDKFLQHAADNRRNSLLRSYLNEKASTPENMTDTEKEILQVVQDYSQKSAELTQHTFSNLDLTK